MAVELLGFNIDNYTFEEAVAEAKSLIDGYKVSQAVTINPEMIFCAEKNTALSNIIREAEMVIPDGMGIKIGLKLSGVKAERIPGIDFGKRLLREAAASGLPVAIIGAKENVVKKAVENLTDEISGLNITYCHDGYFEEDEKIYNDLKAKSPKLILVCMGSPRQEEFIYNAKKVLNPSLMIGLGGSLDVWSGKVKRAPKFIRLIGLEWLYRTLKQPSRLKRIFPALPVFLVKVLISKGRL